MGEWINSDGLRVKLGTTEAEVTRGGELNAFGDYRQWEFNITLSTLGSSSALLADTTGIIIPKDLFVSEVVIINETIATGTNAVMNLGLVRQDTTTTYDVDAFAAAIPLTSMDAVGETTVLRLGSTYAGSAIGTTLAYAGYLVADYDTAAFTAGEIRVIIKGYVKRPAATN